MGMRSANPDHLDQLADELCTPGDGGAYGTLSGALGRARNLDVSAELASLVPLLSWLSDTAGQLRDKAALLRGETPALDFTPGSLADIRAIQEAADADPDAPFEVIGQDNIDRFLALAQDGELTDEDIQEMASLLGAFSDDPNFAAALVDRMGVEEFLALSQEIQDRAGEMDDPEDAWRLREEMGHVLSAAFWVPGNLKPGTGEYEKWINGMPQGRAYAERLRAFQDSDHHGEAAELVNGLINSDDLSVTELEGLNEFLANHRIHPESVGFTRALMSEISPEGLVRLAETLPERISGSGEELRPGYEELQRNIVNALVGVTDVDKPAQSDPWYPHWAATPQGQWYREFITEFDRVGRERFEVGFTENEVRGYQMLIGLMEEGSGYSSTFLNDVGALLRDADTHADEEFWRNYTDAPGLDGIDIDDGELDRIALDPVDSLLGIMGRHPEAAADYFDPADDNLDYLINRDWGTSLHTHSTAPSTLYIEPFPVPLGNGMSGFGDALVAATTGISSDNPTAVPPEHLPEHREILNDALRQFAGTGDAFPAQLRQPFAEILVNHGVEVNQTAGTLREDAMPLEKSALFDVVTQISRNPDAYGHLNEGMNHVIVGSFEDTKAWDGEVMDPNDTLRRGGTTVGFLEEARKEALYGEASDEQARNAWEARFAYHGWGSIANFIPGVGDITQRGIDSITQAWLEDENQSVQDEAEAESARVSERRNSQLEFLMERWYEANEKWAKEDEDYDTPDSRIVEIHEAANVGRNVHEGNG